MMASVIKRAKKSGIAVLILAALTLAFTWPLAGRLDTHIAGRTVHPGLQGDTFFQWNLYKQIRQGRFPDHTFSPYLNYPEGQQFHAKVGLSLHLALYALLMVPFGLLTAHNLAVLLLMFLNALGAWYLLKRRFGGQAFAIGGACVFAFGNYVFLKMEQGFVQKITLFAVPLFALYLLEVIEHQRGRDIALCVVYFAVSILVYPPFAGYDLIFATPLLLLIFARRLFSKRLLLKLTILAAAMLPFLFLVWWIGHRDMYFKSGLDVTLRGFHTEGGYFEPFSPFRFLPYRHTFGGTPWEFVQRLPLGLPVLPLALAALGAIARKGYARSMLAVTVVFLVIMAGPYLTIAGEPVMIGDSPIPLPFKWLGQLPYGSALRMPVRMLPWAVTALLLGAGEGVRWIEDRLRRSDKRARWAKWAPLAIAALMVIETKAVFPEYLRFRVDRVPTPGFCQATAGEDYAAVLHFPFYAPSPHYYEFFCVLCDRAVVNAGLERPPNIELPIPISPLDEKRRFIDALAGHGVRYILLHPDFYAQPTGMLEPTLGPYPGAFSVEDVKAWLEKLCGPPRVFPEDGILAYRTSP